ncbi:hypothetical protein SAMN02745136_01938 [Anaerocolumna jejuensis DSM 15929]|uniref:Mannosyl-glycoprotein endo-beta-N-acetylglucosaminidase n=1 Tax=Anaerocolumna jejuensis DSM 15929 TaxID=1121322 RepID=A0A1M6QAY1_9FIRM|nr:hypothetical protein [Anaerocolumna jejuensis]SHK17315.1 hypothetical protein SAMN02745136_01938 [Anaerocolumna jejuensis DSM 15929]
MSNIDDFVNGTITSNGTKYPVLSLAKWVSYQSFRNSYSGTISVALVLAQWGFEMGWSLTEFSSRFNPGNMDSILEYSGYKDPKGTVPGKRVSFSDVVNGVTAYAHLLIAGYKHVAWAYGTGTGDDDLSDSVKALNDGYMTGYMGGKATYGTTRTGGYALNSPSEKRLWATAGYTGMFATINNHTSLSDNDGSIINPVKLTGFKDIPF